MIRAVSPKITSFSKLGGKKEATNEDKVERVVINEKKSYGLADFYKKIDALDPYGGDYNNNYGNNDGNDFDNDYDKYPYDNNGNFPYDDIRFDEESDNEEDGGKIDTIPEGSTPGVPFF